jgi:hypothetical protein
MPDLIVVYDSEGKRVGTCGSSCYDAMNQECKCICGGENHGVGFRRAMAQTADIVEKVVKDEAQGREICNEAIKLIESQGTEDEDLASHFFKKVVILPDKEPK